MTTTTTTRTLYVALELGQDKWLLAAATQAAEKPRYRSVPARDLDPGSRRRSPRPSSASDCRPTPRSAPATKRDGMASGCTGP